MRLDMCDECTVLDWIHVHVSRDVVKACCSDEH